VLDELVDAGKGTTANRVLATISKLFNWSLGRGYLESSPALGVKPPAKEIARDRVLTLDEVRAIWTAAGTLGYPFGRWTQMMFVTGGQRSGDVSRMLWRDIRGTWWELPGRFTTGGYVPRPCENSRRKNRTCVRVLWFVVFRAIAPNN
jgi:integrase